MTKNLGAFTCYGIEDVYDYLGENRIKLRIQELEDKSTGLFGISLKDFIYRDADDSYFSGKGVFSVFNLLIHWFDDVDFIKFLYEKSKSYNEENYNNGGLLKKKWNEHIEILNSISIDTENLAFIEVSKLNPYWMEYHFFYMQISESIKRAFKSVKELKFDFRGSYKYTKNKLIGNLTLELKTRRKPLTGQYLMYREGFIWYNLEIKEISESFSIYHFIKDKNVYSLILEEDKSSARIELIELNPYAEMLTLIFEDIKLDQFWNEIIADYIKNFKEVSLKIRRQNQLYNTTLLSNGILWNIHDFYKQNNHHQKALEIAVLNNTYLDVWRRIS